MLSTSNIWCGQFKNARVISLLNIKFTTPKISTSHLYNNLIDIKYFIKNRLHKTGTCVKVWKFEKLYV